MVEPTTSVLAHERADTDSAVWAIHHTLGKSANQAAPGNHKHPEYEGGGSSGTEEWLSGSGAPASGLGEVGDFYLNTATADIYEKTAATVWSFRLNIKGPEGDPGTEGPQGPPGSSSGVFTQIWLWTTKTTDANTSGQIGINSTTFAGATQVNINQQTDNNIDVTTFFSKLKVGDEIHIQQKTDSTRWGKYTINATPVDNGTWWSFPVSSLEGSGTLPNGNAETGVAFITQGAQVEEWSGGVGAPGTGAGSIGDWYLDYTTGDVYEKTGNVTWTLRTNIQGPPGQDATTDNVLQNPSFEQWNLAENQPLSWGTFWATTPRGTVSKADGRDVFCYKWVPTSTPGTNNYQRLGTGNPFPIIPGHKWYFSVWCKSEDAANPITLILDVLTAPHDNPDFFVADTTVRTVIASTLVSTTTWTLYEGTLTIPAGEQYARIYISTISPDGSNLRIAYLDQVVAKDLTPSPGSLIPYPTYNALAGTTGTTTPATPIFGLPIPEFTDPPDVPTAVNALAVAVENLVDSIIPVGCVQAYAGPTANFPVGKWIAITGQLVNIVGTYNKLFLAIGHSHAITGDDTSGTATQFRLPDPQRRAIRGAGGSNPLGQTDAGLIGVRAFSHTHGISSNSHNHVVNNTNHVHGITAQGMGTAFAASAGGTNVTRFANADGHQHGGNTEQNSHDHGGNTGSTSHDHTGATDAYNIPYLCLNFFIRYA